MEIKKISVLIPTFNRIKLLSESIESVWNQTLLPCEIIIGDDSSNDDTEKMINEIQNLSTIPIRYYHHNPSLKQSKNVDFLFSQAKGDYLLLLHDDDVLFPRCLECLIKPFDTNNNIIASFGKQVLVDDIGNEIEGTDSLNKTYFRTSDRAGIVEGLFAGANSMFPNDAFLVKKEFAIEVKYNDDGYAGDAVDFYFGFRLGKLGKPFYFVDEFTAKYRITRESVSNNRLTDTAYKAVQILLMELNSRNIIVDVDQTLINKMPVAIMQAVKLKDRRTAFKWLFSKYHIQKLFTLGGIKRLLYTIKPV